MEIRENWRIVMLVVLVVLSAFALFVPGGNASPAANQTDTSNVSGIGPNQTTSGGLTNLQFGLELSGGTRLRGQPIGLTAENIPVTTDNANDIAQTVATELNIDRINVTVRQQGTVEVFSGGVTESEFASALNEAGLNVTTDQIRDGVTEQTLQTLTNVITNRVNAVGISGGGASIVRSATGQDFVVVEVPNTDISQVKDVITTRGSVLVKAVYPVQTDNGTVYRNTTVLTQDSFAGISPAEQASQGNPPRVPVTLKPAAAERFAQVLKANGFTGNGVSNCRVEQSPDDPGWCLYTYSDGERIYSAGLGVRLADDIDSGAFVNNPSFVLETGGFSEAQEVQISLESGALPTTLDIESQYYLSPSYAQSFKPLSLLTGLLAWLVVSGVVYYRYREVRIAIPMLLTAGAEVFILLGFAATVGLALDLSHIAGLIAVIGTGVDDLVIIADEILQEGEVATGRVFQNRFRKAFWVIGAAAATTIIAMSPLAILSLGDLQGFAIVTIVGVLIGVLVTRPAYGDVLRNLLLEES